MHEHKTRHDAGEGTAAHPARATATAPATDLSAAGNRAVSDALGPRSVQRWPDFEDLGGLLGGGGAPSMGNPTPDPGGLMGGMPSLPSMPELPSMPSLPSFNIPGVSLDVNTDAGTASGGIDFHNGTNAHASYGPGGVDASGQFGRASGSAHASAMNDWSVQGGGTTKGGTTIAGGLSDDHGRFGGSLGARGANGDGGLLSGFGGGGGGFGGRGTYSGEYGNTDLLF
jgi:hypothetical protein